MKNLVLILAIVLSLAVTPALAESLCHFAPSSVSTHVEGVSSTDQKTGGCEKMGGCFHCCFSHTVASRLPSGTLLFVPDISGKHWMESERIVVSPNAQPPIKPPTYA